LLSSFGTHKFSDFAQTTLDGVRAVRPGKYRVWFGVKKTADFGMGYAETTIVAV
jgi:hypothetical protein